MLFRWHYDIQLLALTILNVDENSLVLFLARCYAERGIATAKSSVRLSVRLYVRDVEVS